jgi:AcrR family transcriptional regulator
MTPRSATSTGGRPLRRDAERNRQQILVAARAAFAERGLEVTLDEIAERAGVGVGTVYRRYANKDDLIDELYEDIVNELGAAAEAELAQNDPWKGLVGFLEQSLAMQASNSALKEIMAGGSHRGRERVARARERVAPLASEIFERAKQSGRLRPDVTETDMATIHMMLGAVIDSTRATEPDAWRRYFGIVLDGLRTRRNTPTELTPVAPGQPNVDVEPGTITRRPAKKSKS